MSHEVRGELIGVITTRVGLTVNAKLDKKQYPINVKVTAEGLASVNLGSYALHRERTYTFRPSRCMCRPVEETGSCSSRFSLFPSTFRPDCLIPLNQSVSLPASSPH